MRLCHLVKSHIKGVGISSQHKCEIENLSSIECELDLALQVANAFYKKENKSRRHLNFENDCPKKQLQKQKKEKKMLC